MELFQAGFARLDITPPLGLHLSGYYETRVADGIRDPLYVSALAVGDGSRIAILLSLDVLGLSQETCDSCRALVASRTGVAADAVIITCTHIHTGPALTDGRDPVDAHYADILFRKMADAAYLAIADLKPAAAAVGRGLAPHISFVRRFRMKDGSVRTNPGTGNPDILEPLGEPDETVQLVRLQRPDAPDILLVNFQVHPDVIGGCSYSADYPGFVRQSVEQSLDSVRCLYFNGAQGDTNHINVWPEHGEGGMAKDFDGVSRGYEHARHMGRCIAGAVLQICTEMQPVRSGPVLFAQMNCQVPANRASAGQIRRSEEIIRLHEGGRDSELGYSGMELTTIVAEAYRMKRLENGPDFFDLRLSSLSFGDIAFSGIPGEPFTDIGRHIKQESPFAMTFVCCCANGFEGYYPTWTAFSDGGYEARSSSFKPGVAEQLTGVAGQMLQLLQEEKGRVE